MSANGDKSAEPALTFGSATFDFEALFAFDALLLSGECTAKPLKLQSKMGAVNRVTRTARMAVLGDFVYMNRPPTVLHSMRVPVGDLPSCGGGTRRSGARVAQGTVNSVGPTERFSARSLATSATGSAPSGVVSQC